MNQASMVAVQYRLQEWAAQIKECNNRPHGMTVDEWCSNYGVTKAKSQIPKIYAPTMERLL